MTLLQEVQASLALSPANAARHPFFARFVQKKTIGQIRLFAQQWYLAARNHKIAFTGLVHTTQDDDTRQELIEILRDEYGNGDKSKIHARLLQKFLMLGAGVAVPRGDWMMIPEVAAFGQTTLEIWENKLEPVKAFGYHYTLEHIAKDIHKDFYAGLKDEFSEETLAYFAYHTTAEEEHVAITEAGFNRYANVSENHKALLAGVNAGENALVLMWSGFNRHVFHS